MRNLNLHLYVLFFVQFVCLILIKKKKRKCLNKLLKSKKQKRLSKLLQKANRIFSIFNEDYYLKQEPCNNNFFH